jgi:hypothetical protein
VKASHISCYAVKLRCADEWGRWDRLSDDGPGQHNPDRSEGPWGRAASAVRTVVRLRTTPPTLSGDSVVGEADRTKDRCKPIATVWWVSGRHCLTYRP